MESWISEQTKLSISQFDQQIAKYYPDSSKYFSDPHEFFNGLTNLWNYLDAVKMIDWGAYLKNQTIALDIGGGTGWLSGFISKFDSVEKVILVDSNKRSLTDMAPEMIRLIKGKHEKICFVEGLFSPLLAQDSSVDVVLVCSALHHADNLVALLKEINRILKKDGLLFILNETPYSTIKFLSSITKQFIIITRDILFKKFKPISTSISSAGFLYDPFLNDRAYPLWYFKKAIKESHFSIIELIKTGLPTLKDEKGTELTHFICKKL